MRIELLSPLKYRHPHRGAQVIAPGTYYVPRDLEQRLADRAIASGIAKDLSEPVVQPVWPARKQSPRKKFRGAAPENK